MKVRVFILFITILLLATACQQEEIKKPVDDSPKVISVEKSGKLNVEDVWARVGAKGRNTAMFMNIKNGTEQADTLLSAESDAALLVEIHETYKRENDIMGMRQVENVVVPSLQQVSLKPRGLHVMLITLNNDLMIGDTVKATLSFSNAGIISITGTVKEMD